MFYICEKVGDKFGVKDTRDGVVEYYTSEELNSIKKTSGLKLFGSYKSGYDVVEMEEYQEFKWDDRTIFSFYNKANKRVYTGVENCDKSKILYYRTAESYVDEWEVKSNSEHRNGDLGIIFEDGRDTKCIGFYLWLNYYSGSSPDDYELKVLDTLLEYRQDGKIYEIKANDWNFDECGAEPYYNSEKDCISWR